jgi:NAD(P)-dependent dehydrogenase (short-subunit alcohol dehydrogenase family)
MTAYFAVSVQSRLGRDDQGMRDFVGKTAFVTGGASGIGLALGRAFAAAGSRVMLADIERAVLDAAVRNLEGVGPMVRGVVCDVADPASVEHAAEQATAAFGNIHILCNNAGVAAGSGSENISLDNWRWVLDVNLLGVVNSLAALLPHMRAHGEGGHIVNTASMAGMLSGGLGFSPYVASKFAVVAMSEGLANELKPFGIGVSVLCPGFVRTRIAEAGRNRPARYGVHAESRLTSTIAELVRAGMDPQEVAGKVLNAILNNELYVFTHAEYRSALEARFAAILAAYDKLGDR